ncbi:MAG: KEOPS complex subunit Cgi121 [Methanomicrobiales archaeon]|nr:KEOPS complex subunit Cgi121 [Methanomicrobiales archaeon]
MMGLSGDFEIVQAVVLMPQPEGLIDTIREIGSRHGCRIVCLDAERLAGREHVRMAAQYGIRSWKRGTAIADSLEMEILLYAGGTRQTSIARAYGIDPGTRNLYLCFIPSMGGAKGELEAWVKLVTDDWDEISEEKIVRLMELFGITKAEREIAGDRRFANLVLERVALLDVYR